MEQEYKEKPIKCELYHDNFQNFKQYNIPKAQLVIADIPYNIGIDAYASNPMWYEGGDNKNGESKKAASSFFANDGQFKIAEYMHFCNLYRDKLPKFNNIDPCTGKGKMVFNWFEWKRDSGKEYPKIHPTQKPVSVLKRLIEIFTDAGDVVIDPVAGSGTTLRAAYEMGRNAYGFEVSKDFYNMAQEKMLCNISTAS